MSKKILSVFVLGLLIGAFVTSGPPNVEPVIAVRRTTPTPTRVSTPTPSPVQNQVGGFYKDLTGANLDSAFLAYHDFSGFTFTNASLRYVNLHSAYLNNASMNGADFTGANLTGVNITGTKLDGVKWYSCPQGEGQCGTTTCPDGITFLSTDGAVCF
ncbi:pentapeptide repeat-containing protein [Candidatus Shapirobacteria bacterium]|nr:pentapeptide repeat-containing protein [Candidatus Shapirobacteria bacterium]